VFYLWLYNFLEEILVMNWIFSSPFWTGEDPVSPLTLILVLISMHILVFLLTPALF
jgi:hypothetical protein